MSGAAVESAQSDAFQSDLVADNYVPDGAYVASIRTGYVYGAEVTVRVPDGVREGDILIAWAQAYPSPTDSSGTFSISGSWTALDDDSFLFTTPAYSSRQDLWYRVVAANPDQAEQVTFTNSDATDRHIHAAIVRVVGTYATTPIADWGFSSDQDIPASSPKSIVLPTLTAADDSVYVAFISSFYDHDFTSTDANPLPTGFDQWAFDENGASVLRVAYCIATSAELSEGDISPTGSIAWTGSAGAQDYGAGYVIAGVLLQPTPSGAGTTVTPLFFWDLF